jgi:hypothetical protein
MLEIWENVSETAQSMWEPVGLWLSNPENWAVGVMLDRVTPSNHNHPDTKQVMKDLHKYFEHKYDGCMIDFDI